MPTVPCIASLSQMEKNTRRTSASSSLASQDKKCSEKSEVLRRWRVTQGWMKWKGARRGRVRSACQLSPNNPGGFFWRFALMHLCVFKLSNFISLHNLGEEVNRARPQRVLLPLQRPTQVEQSGFCAPRAGEADPVSPDVPASPCVHLACLAHCGQHLVLSSPGEAVLQGARWQVGTQLQTRIAGDFELLSDFILSFIGRELPA